VRKIITGVIAVAMLAVPTVANAAVAVDETGTGLVGKGDVQDALGGLTDAQMQTMHEDDKVKFTTGYDFTIDYLMQCSTFTGVKKGTSHQIVTTAITQDAKVTANTNRAGKLTNGWNLNGFDGPTTPGATTFTPATCPTGQYVSGSISQETIYGPRSGLKINGVDLPNTPIVDPAPVA
jgi:hypothetical protein